MNTLRTELNEEKYDLTSQQVDLVLSAVADAVKEAKPVGDPDLEKAIKRMKDWIEVNKETLRPHYET